MPAKADPPALGEQIRRSLADIEQIETVLVQEVDGRVWVICDPGADAQPLGAQVRERLERVEGAGELELELVVRLESMAQRRVRLREVRRFPEPEGRSRISVELEWQGRTYEGAAVGGDIETMELRTAASAALEALTAVLGRSVGARVVGAKTIRAFDVDLVVVSVVRDEPEDRYLVGAVPRSSLLIRSAAMALLQALNRVLARDLGPPDG